MSTISNIISINGKTFSVNGHNISVMNNRIYVNGKEIENCGELNGIVKMDLQWDTNKMLEYFDRINSIKNFFKRNGCTKKEFDNKMKELAAEIKYLCNLK